MTRFAALRALDDRACRQINAQACLTRAGLQVRQGAPDVRQRYLHLRVEARGQRFDAWVELGAWLEACAPELASLAWLETDDDYLLDLVATLSPAIDWEQGWLTDARVTVLGVTRTGAVAGDSMLVLSSRQGDVFCAELPELLWPASASWSDRLPIKLAVRIGRQRVSPRLLEQIEPGDVLLVLAHEPVLACNGCDLFSYSIQQENIMVQQPVNPAAQSADQTVLTDSQQIPVVVEFVLQELDLTVGDLAALGPGQVFSLHSDAERNVLVRANGVAVARGELVQLDQQLGVEIKSVLLGR